MNPAKPGTPYKEGSTLKPELPDNRALSVAAIALAFLDLARRFGTAIRGQRATDAHVFLELTALGAAHVTFAAAWRDELPS